MPEKITVPANGVSVIACTNKPNFMHNIISNFTRQKIADKELIIVLNEDSLKLSEWKKAAKDYESVHVYQLPERESLGACLSFGAASARYDYIAKFDDDDYYAHCYLAEALQVFKNTGADIVGKRSYYMYLTDRELLLLRHPSRENRWCPLVAGGTIVARRKVFAAVPLVHKRVGTAFQFVVDARKRGFLIYSSSRFNYTYVRRNDNSHTWNPDQEYFFRTSKEVAFTSDFRDYVNWAVP